MTAWANYIRTVTNGQPITAESDTAPILGLVQRTQYLREALDAAVAGRALVEFDVPLDPLAVVCTPVYIDLDGVWKPALAEVYTSGTLVGRLKPSANVAGFVATKTGPTRGHVVLSGMVDGLPWANVTPGVPVPGHYALSAVTAGKLVPLNTASAAVACGQLLTTGTFLVAKAPKNGAEDHLHFRFALSGEPAVPDYTDVIPPGVGAVHVINPADIDLAVSGWVPMSHVAAPPAPPGAKFWYNIAADPALAQAFPPVPVAAYFATQGRGVVLETDLVITTQGVFWMTDAYGTVPWPVEYGTLTHDSSPTISLFLAKMTGDTFSRTVRSLTPSLESVLPIRIVSSTGEDAITGDLSILIEELLPIASTASLARRAVKSVADNAALLGPVVTGIYTTTAGIRITAEELVDGLGGIGRIGIGIDAGLINNWLTPELVRHIGTREDLYQDFSYVAFPSGRETTAVFSFVVPQQGTPPVSNFTVNLLWLGVATAASMAVSLSAKVASAGAAVPAGWLSLGSMANAPVTGQVVTTTSAVVVPGVKPGDVIIIRITRPVDAVSAVAGILHARGTLTP